LKKGGEIMKKISFLVGALVFVGVFVFGGICYGKVVFIENSKGGVPVVIEKSDYTLSDVPKLGAEPCKGFKYGTIYKMEGLPILLNKAELEPYGKIATHGAPDPNVYACYIIKGEGEMGLVDSKGNTVAKVNYTAGDVLIFRPNNLHYWKGGAQKTEILVVQYLSPGS
jgi:quercetin dioxygenase-like cupin family protein